jgi:hypothetical protein
MDQKPSNPLLKHFRQPAIYINLPGKALPYMDNTVDMPVTGEVPVYPMTTKDEITIRTPDSLINGTCVVDVVQSCIPAIKNAWNMPSVDIDAALIAIRIASYGHEMELKVKCPQCEHENEFGVDLRGVLDRMVVPDFSKIIEIDGLKYKLRPQTYFTTNKVNMVKFEEQKMLTQLLDSSTDEKERLDSFRKKMQDLVELNTEVLADCTEYIQLSDNSIVNDQSYIKEFYKNCDSKIAKQLSDFFRQSNEHASESLVQATCSNCEASFSTSLEFDYASFFGKGF